MMTKAETIDAIRALNPSANPDFLVEFSMDDLIRYLDRLTGPSGSYTFRTPAVFQRPEARRWRPDAAPA